MNISDTHVLLYSFSQSAFHIETLDKTVNSGMRALEKNRPNDYIIVAVGPTRADIDRSHEQIMATFKPTTQ